MQKFITLTLLGLSTVAMVACAPRIGGNDYSVQGAGEASRTIRGTVVALRSVNISAQKENQPGVGALAGAVAGGVIGTQFGGGRGRIATTGLGALAGAGAGHFAERLMTDQEGIEYQVQADNGELLTIAQGKDPMMSVGQRVLVIMSHKDRSRIVPDNSGR